MAWRLGEEQNEIFPLSSALLRRSPMSQALASHQQATTCSSCGNVYMADSNFCRHCGHKRDIAQAVACSQCGNVYMADSSFCRKCGNQRDQAYLGSMSDMGAKPASRRPLSLATSPGAAHVEDQGQSLDDLCDQIRMLRASVFPEGLRHSVQPDEVAKDWHPVSATAGASLTSEPVTRSARGSAPPSTGQWLPSSSHGGAVGSNMDLSSRGYSRTYSPLRYTLWEERQLCRCMQAWWRLARDGPVTSTAAGNGAQPLVAVAPKAAGHDVAGDGAQLLVAAAPEAEAAGRLDRFWRAWKKLTAAWKAKEIELSVKLLNAQVERQVKHGLDHWLAWVHQGRGQRHRRETCDQASALLRVRSLKRALCQLLAASKLSKVEDKARSADEAGRIAFRQRALLAGLQRWSRCSRTSVQLRACEGRLRKQRIAAQQLAVLKRLGALCGAARQICFAQDVAEVHAQDKARLTFLRRWIQWCRQKQRRRAVLRGHLQARALPRCLGQAFQAWSSHAREEQRNHTMFHKARIVLDLSLKSRIFHAWLSHRQCIQQATGLLKGLSGSLASAFQGELLASWQTAAKRLRAERAALECLTAGASRLLQACCLAQLREHMLLRRRSEQQLASADSLRELRSLAKVTKLWHSATAQAKHERSQDKLADGHRRRAEMYRCYHLWWAHLVAGRLEVKQNTLATHQNSSRLLRLACSQLCAYARERQRRRHLSRPWSSKVAAAALVARRQRTLASWAKASATRQKQGQRGWQLRRRVLQAFSMWRARQRRERQVVAICQTLRLQKQRQQTLSAWSGLHGAIHHHLGREQRGLTTKAFRSWKAWLLEVLEVAEGRVQHGQQRRRHHLLVAAIVFWCKALLDIRSFCAQAAGLLQHLEVVIRRQQEQRQMSALDAWWAHVESCRAHDNAQLVLRCLHGWQHISSTQQHKRDVHMLCMNICQSRITRKAFAGWKGLVARISAVQDAVWLWSSNRATDRVQFIVSTWCDWARRRRNSIKAAELVQQRRRSALLGSWRFLLLRRLTVTGVMQAVLRMRGCCWLRAWRQWAEAQVRQRRRDTLKTEFVRQSRQRAWIERWSAAGRFHRLTGVAEEWDGKVLCPLLVRHAFRRWSGLMGTLHVGEKVAARIGVLRASSHLRHWSFLLVVGAKRVRSTKKQAMAAWLAARDRGRSFQRGLDRLCILTMKPIFNSFSMYVRSQKDRRKKEEEHHATLQASREQRTRSSALRFWNHCFKEVRREKQLEIQCAPDVENDLRREQLVLQMRRRCALGTWHEAWLWHRAESWQERNPRLAMEITGETMAHLAFLTLAARSDHRRQLRKAEDEVRALCSKSRQVRVFDEWAKVYEHESSSVYATLIMDRWRLSRMFALWRKHIRFHINFLSHLNEVKQIRNNEWLQRCMAGWIQRLKRRRVAAGMWLERRKAWKSWLLRAWLEAAEKALLQRMSLKQLQLQAKFLKASRGAGEKCAAGNAKLLASTFSAYARWVRQARDLKARAADFAALVSADRCRRRLCAWAAHSRAIEASSNSASVAFSGWVDAARRGKSLSWASRSVLAGRSARACRGSLGRLHSWALLRRGIRALFIGTLSRLAARALRAWSLRLLPIRTATQWSRRRAADHLGMCFGPWANRTAAVVTRVRHAEVLRSRSLGLRAGQVATAWVAWGRRRAAAKRLGNCLARADQRWLDEEEWSSRALASSGLRAMFHRFAEAFDERRSGDRRGEKPSLLREGAFEALMSLIWARQQLSVAMGRLRGYEQPWLLGCWAEGPLPLLSPTDPYYAQAEMRLAVMVTELEAQRSKDKATSIFKMAEERADCKDQAPAWQRVLMWQALADLLVVHHPGWRQDGHGPEGPAFGKPLGPAARGSAVRASSHCPCGNAYAADSLFCRRCGRPRDDPTFLPSSCFGGHRMAVEPVTATRLLDAPHMSGCGDATASATFSLLDGVDSDSTPSFGYPATFSSGDQAAGILAA
eukprot:TRINITY_DN33363_c0_g1_i1.p1 TRINITY_DN33363_c0_g1~~TRINITY_DN33363_c0_g1_i1.p1  ORF type:complete len:1965 (-),score=357.52 TRINITY_DN33363_c0_g1_i1:47-5941(-)